MSNALFHDTVTLYTPTSDGGWERHFVSLTQYCEDTNGSEITATIYIPIFGRRSLSYLPSSERNEGDPSTFTVTIGQRIVLGKCSEASPPQSSLGIEKITVRSSGSRRIQHIKLIAKSILFTNEEESYE